MQFKDIQNKKECRPAMCKALLPQGPLAPLDLRNDDLYRGTTRVLWKISLHKISMKYYAFSPLIRVLGLPLPLTHSSLSCTETI